MSILKELDTPVFAAEGMPAEADPEKWRVRIRGLAEGERELSLPELKGLPLSRVDCRLTSVSGWSVRAEWEGVLWRDFMKAFPPETTASYAVFRSVRGYSTCAPLSELDHPRVLLAWAAGGEPLEIEYGGPLRMVIPNLWGYKSCKWVSEIEYTDRMVPGFWETRGYSLEGRILPGMTFDVNTKRKRPIKGGEVLDF